MLQLLGLCALSTLDLSMSSFLDGSLVQKVLSSCDSLVTLYLAGTPTDELDFSVSYLSMLISHSLSGPIDSMLSVVVASECASSIAVGLRDQWLGQLGRVDGPRPGGVDRCVVHHHHNGEHTSNRSE